MSPMMVGGLSFLLLLMLLGLGIPVAFAMAMVGFISFWVISGIEPGLGLCSLVPFSSVAHYTFTVMPMFVLLGNFAFRAGFGKDIYWTARQWVGRAPGGLAIATIYGCAAFGAASGSSIAAAATIGRMSVPEMEKYGYDRKLAAGSVAAGGPLAAMIPPSILMVIYGMCTETSIGKLLVAGFLPGIMAATLMSLSIFVRAWRNPELGRSVLGITWKDRFASVRGIWGILLIALAVMGSIYTGLATPTEAGAFGAFAALIIGVVSGRLNVKGIWGSLLDTTKTVAMIFCIVMGAFMFNYQFAVSRLPFIAADYIAALPYSPIVILLAIMLLYIILGAFLDTAAMLFLTLPLIFPIVTALGFNSIWFGILIVQNCEIGMITPPFGLTLFATKSVIPGMSTTDIIRGAMPFLLPLMVQLALLIAFPQIALFLPSLMK